VHRRIDRPADCPHPLSAEILLRRCQEPRRDFPVAQAFEEAEEADRIMMELEKMPVQNRGDPAHNLVTFSGQKQTDLSVLKEGVLAGQELALL
jgi:hypothetical protein